MGLWVRELGLSGMTVLKPPYLFESDHRHQQLTQITVVGNRPPAVSSEEYSSDEGIEHEFQFCSDEFWLTCLLLALNCAIEAVGLIGCGRRVDENRLGTGNIYDVGGFPGEEIAGRLDFEALAGFSTQLQAKTGGRFC